MNDVSEMISGHVFDMLDPQQVRELCDWIKADRENARRFARETLILAHVRQQIIGESNLRLEAESQALSAEEDPIDDRFDSTLILQAVEQDLRASQTRRQATDQTSPSVPVRLSPVHVSDSASEPQRRYIVIPRSVVYLAVAAMAAVFILAVQPWFRSNQQMFLPPSHDPAGFEVARLTEAVNCVWDDPQVPTQSGAELRPGKLNLVQGRARITFRSGAQVVLAAPCTFEIKNDMRGYLHGGQLSANVPRRARGFTVETRSVQIVDLGTEFGVRIEPTTGEVEVHVFAGEVEAHMLDRRGVPHRTKRLMSDEAARFDSRNEQITAITVDERPFHRTTLANTPYAAQVLADRPLGYWPLTEQAGQMIIEDHSGNHFHGRVHGQVDVAGTTGSNRTTMQRFSAARDKSTSACSRSSAWPTTSPSRRGSGSMIWRDVVAGSFPLMWDAASITDGGWATTFPIASIIVVSIRASAQASSTCVIMTSPRRPLC